MTVVKEKLKLGCVLEKSWVSGCRDGESLGEVMWEVGGVAEGRRFYS